MQLAIFRQGGGGEAAQFDATLKIDSQPTLRISILAYKPKEASLRVYRTNLRANEFEPFRQAESIAIRSPGLNEAFALSNMAPLLKTMDNCLVGLRLAWNITDPTGVQSSLKERSKADIAKFFSNDDYPAVALNQNQSGTVAFALLVDESGKVADCTIIGTSGAAVLDAQSCGILQRRAKFAPAIGVDGKPAKDAVIARVRWVIP
jgi:TonB family protein